MQRYRVVIMLVLFGVLPVVVAFFFALSYLEEQEQEPAQVQVAPVVEEPPEPEPPPMQEVLAAARALPVGTLIGSDDLTTLALAPDAVRVDHFVAGDIVSADALAGALRGHAVREAISEGAPLRRSAIVGPHQKGFLATVLKPGSRAVTIRVGPATSHAGLIDHGARVDVILTAELAVDGGERSAVARTIVEDVRVVAIDRGLGTGEEPLPAAGEGEDASVGVGVERAEIVTATLETSPAQADRLVLGENEGRLSLAVRSLAVAQDPDAAPAVAVDLREILLTPEEFSASEARMKRAQKLEDITVRTQIVESREQLRAAVEASPDKWQGVKVFRGTEPAEEVMFKRR